MRKHFKTLGLLLAFELAFTPVLSTSVRAGEISGESPAIEDLDGLDGSVSETMTNPGESPTLENTGGFEGFLPETLTNSADSLGVTDPDTTGYVGRTATTNKTFTLGRDNNSFRHNNGSGGGFEGRKVRMFHDSTFFDALTNNAPSWLISQVKKTMHSKWGGSCYGVTSTMGRVFRGIDSVSDYSSYTPDPANYFDLGRPVDDELLDDVINCYQLSQKYNNGYKNLLCYSIKEKGDMAAFLEKFVANMKDGNPKLFSYAYYNKKQKKVCGHAIMAIESSDKGDGSYIVKLYDLNSVSKAAKGEFTEMQIASDYSSFSYTTPGNMKLEDVWVNLRLYDWDKLWDLRKAVGQMNISNDQMDLDDNCVRLEVSSEDSFVLTAEDSKKLTVSNGSISGNLTTMDVDMDDCWYEICSDDEEDSTGDCLLIDIPLSDSYTLSPCNEDDDIEISLMMDGEYISIILDGYEEAVLSFSDPVEVKGDDYSFEYTEQTDNVLRDNEQGLVTISGQASGDITFTDEDDELTVSSDSIISSVETSTHIGNAVYTREEEDARSIDASTVDTSGTKIGNNDNSKGYGFVEGVTLNKSSLSLAMGDSETLTATVSPNNVTNKSVTWTSSNENVATVKDGLVTGTGLGTANITVTTVSGNLSATCAVTVGRKFFGQDETNSVMPGGKIDVSSVFQTRIDEAKAAGQKYKFLLDKASKKLISISKKGIVKGKGKKAGTASIAFMVRNGKKWEQKGDAYTVTVELPIMKKKLDTKVGSTENLNVYDFLSGTDYAPTSWELSKKGIISLDEDGTIHILKKGSVVVYAVFGNGLKGNLSTKKKYKTKIKVKAK
ncbi:MAG: Ig-like domain-containing protein [Lachnospiraceae bacterium]|nr:Ig-like domain-containing protein [Lachnospiraceae bacterium]